ncbi:spore germination protein YaaH [Oxobacter pfennigii]|uniref:Spore germination protein YaaH n=1 Tax=Oxobacter pfennigii TaxID=36849 RepID=A0A0P8X5R8_9CLOT|nr:LysM peptidoglycan-binding domain-containing protein [Oxobacter pfennigii]KPU46221.1 spore germination protein YaaH [Oxobacter pfennigii]
MFIHVVKPGDTLWKIANYYRVPISGIVEVNGLPNPNLLLIGQSLIIPVEDTLYTVRWGDTLWKIAQSFGTTVQEILQINNIANPSNILPGLTLYIPSPKHTIGYGETLSQIARMYGISAQTLAEANNIEDPNMIYPGTVLVIPRKERPVIEVNGYIYQYGERGAEIVREDGRHLTYLSPFAYRIMENGNLVPIADAPSIAATYDTNTVPMMSITNFTSTELGENLAHVVLSSRGVQEVLLANIINIMKEKRYMGLNVDFENVLPEDREPYNRFLMLAVERLHPLGYFVSSALAPKVSAEQQGLLYTAHDYEAHGRILDFVILMTYEWGYRLGPPQAISPLNQIKRVLDYAVSVIPRDKIFFGFQLYARDWLLPHIRGQEAQTFSPQEAVIRATNNNATIQYDTAAQSPFFRYTDRQGRNHEVWFEDARSAQAKFDAVKEYKLRGISYWALGYPFPQNWVLLRDNFTVKKLI